MQKAPIIYYASAYVQRIKRQSRFKSSCFCILIIGYEHRISQQLINNKFHTFCPKKH